VADDRTDSTSMRPRPRPAGDQNSTGASNLTRHGTSTAASAGSAGSGRGGRPTWQSRRAGRGLARVDAQQGQQVVAAAGNAIVTAARVGRLLSRSSWRIARQLPGVDVVEKQAEKLRQAAAAEMLRMLELPQGLLSNATPEEQRVMMLVHNSSDDGEPLRSAMTELLHRANEPDATSNRDYLYGTIVSQLVPDEARILAALAEGRSFAVVDVVVKDGRRSPERTVLTDASTVGRAAGVASPASTPTYVGRLRGFGLVDVGPDGASDLVDQYVQLADDPGVAAARDSAGKGKGGSVRLVRHSLTMSTFGAEFWKACAPARSAIERGAG
jgi:Abortive infection alpha